MTKVFIEIVEDDDPTTFFGWITGVVGFLTLVFVAVWLFV